MEQNYTLKCLGNYLDYNMKEKTGGVKNTGDLIQRVNSLLVTRGISSDAVVKTSFKTQCAHLYGAAAWDFSVGDVAEFQTL